VAKTKTRNTPKSKNKSKIPSRRPAAARRNSSRGATTPAATAKPVRLARVAKGRKPLYFSDPAIDKLLWMTMTLMEELSVTRDRLDTVERLLEGKRVLRRRDIEGFVAAGAAQSERSARRAAFVDRMLRAVEAELEEVAGGSRTAPADDAVAAVSS
jgi:hypothetical protein